MVKLYKLKEDFFYTNQEIYDECHIYSLCSENGLKFFHSVIRCDEAS